MKVYCRDCKGTSRRYTTSQGYNVCKYKKYLEGAYGEEKYALCSEQNAKNNCKLFKLKFSRKIYTYITRIVRGVIK